MARQRHDFRDISPLTGEAVCRLCGPIQAVRVPEGKETRWRCPAAWQTIAYKESISAAQPAKYVRISDPTAGARATGLKTRYGLTPDDYALLLSVQDGLCAICKTPETDEKPLHVDHDHDTGRVRGLLCLTCNAGLGMFKDRLDLLEQATYYLTMYAPEPLAQKGAGAPEMA